MLAGCRSATTLPTALRRCCGAQSAVVLPQAVHAQREPPYSIPCMTSDAQELSTWWGH
jgi:hypothetical protein